MWNLDLKIEVLNRCPEYFLTSTLWAGPQFCPGGGEFKLIRIKRDQKGITNAIPLDNSVCKTKQSYILGVSWREEAKWIDTEDRPLDTENRIHDFVGVKPWEIRMCMEVLSVWKISTSETAKQSVSLYLGSLVAGRVRTARVKRNLIYKLGFLFMTLNLTSSE